MPAMPNPWPLRASCVGAQRLVGHAALARDLDPPLERGVGILRRSASCARGWGASTARSPCARRSSRPARSGRSGRACRRRASRSPRAGSPGRARARGARTTPARACRCRPGRSRRPPRSPTRCSAGRRATGAAGAGARRPGSTRSPRPSSRLRVGAGIEVQPSGSLRRETTFDQEQRHDRREALQRRSTARSTPRRRSASPTRTSLRSPTMTSKRRSPCGAPGGRENVRGQVDALAPDGVRDFLNGIIGAVPGPRLRGRREDRAGRPRRRPLGGDGHVHRDDRSRASSPTAPGSSSRAWTS